MLESMHAIFHLMETLKKLKRSWTHENNFTVRIQKHKKVILYSYFPLFFCLPNDIQVYSFFHYFAAKFFRLENGTSSIAFYYVEGKLDLWTFGCKDWLSNF